MRYVVQQFLPVLLTAVVGFQAIATSAADAAMLITSVSRNTSAPPNSDANAAAGLFNSVVLGGGNTTLATQLSDVGTDAISGNLTAFKLVPTTNGAASDLTVAFTLTADHFFSLISNLSAVGVGLANVTLTAGTGSISPFGSPLSAPLGGSDFNGILSAGTYILTASAVVGPTDTLVTGSASSAFELLVTAVPEPSSLALIGMASACGLVGAARRRRNRIG